MLDALVIGGGPSGGTAALLLARAGWSVGLVEKASFPRRKVCGEFLSVTNLPLLEFLGVADAFLGMAGPGVSQVGLFAGDHVVTSEMPRADSNTGLRDGLGHALGRDHLDTMLLARAKAAGARLWQPWTAVEIRAMREGYRCTLVDKKHQQTMDIETRIIIAAHGSWEPGRLPSQPLRPAARPSDLFGFKAHFLDSRLPIGLMPLLIFPGGYGGMVHSDQGRVSVSVCIRRDQLEHVRSPGQGTKAAAAVLAHVQRSCRGAREALTGATLEHEWLSAGPIRPGIRHCGYDGVFLVGNAAGEAHPAVAEGIGMAMQSAWSLCKRLTDNATDVSSPQSLESVRRDYMAAWHRAVAPRIHTAAMIAQWTMMPAAVACALPLLRLFPRALSMGARMSGKTTMANEAVHAPLRARDGVGTRPTLPP